MHYDIEKKAKKRVRRIKAFYRHFFIYMIFGLFFFFMNMLTDPSEMWFVFPLLPWGVGVAIHYLVVIGVPGSKFLSKQWEEEELERQIKKLEEETPNHLEYTELSELEILELRQMQKEGRRWKEQDFV